MAERIIHLLEAIEVEAEYGKALAALHPHLHLLQLLLESRPIAQTRQRIVVREERDLNFRAAPVGDVLVGGNPAARRHGRVLHQDFTPLRGFDDQIRDIALGKAAQQFHSVLLGVEIEIAAGLDAMLQQVDHDAARFHHVTRKSVHLDVKVIADDDPFVGVEHDQALRHVVDRGFEPRNVLPQIARG
jgi:hypothetical protein